MSHRRWLRKFENLNVYRAKHGIAPHKPLLLIVILELAQQQRLPLDGIWLTAELSFRFDSFWHVVAHRRTQPPDVRFPFHHLGTDGFWEPCTESGEPSAHRELTRYAKFDPTFRECLSDDDFRQDSLQVLVATYFELGEQHALCSLLGIPVPAGAVSAQFKECEDAERTGREVRFRLDIVPAYNYTCALTGYRITTVGLGTIIDAAHIHQFSDSRNNDPRNGIALCKNAHWLFDVGLWTIGDDYRIIIAKGMYSEVSPDQKPLASYQGAKLRLPSDEGLWPHPRHLAWHRKHRFQGKSD